MKRANGAVINDLSNWQPISVIEFNIFYWSVNPKRNQPWIFIGRTDAEAEALIIRPLDAKSWLIGKDPDAGKDWGQKEKETTQDETVWWHHGLNRHKFEQTLWDSEGQGSMMCCSPQGRKESDTTEQQQSIVDLQCCVSFRCMAKWFIYIWHI